MVIFENLKKIRVMFENVETVEFDYKDIVYFDLKDIVSNLTVRGNNVIELKIAKKAIFAVKNNKNNQKSISRIQAYNDITNFSLLFEDGTIKTVYVTWSENSTIDNKYKSSIANKDNLFVCIGEGLNPRIIFSNHIAL